MLDARRLADLDAFVLDLNRASAEVILPLFRADHGLEDKGGAKGFDPVTAADRGAEAAIRKLITARFPDHGVVGEEYGRGPTDAEFVWVLDPVDGTRAFIAGLPVWTTLISLRHEGEPCWARSASPTSARCSSAAPAARPGEPRRRDGRSRCAPARTCPRRSSIPPTRRAISSRPSATPGARCEQRPSSRPPGLRRLRLRDGGGRHDRPCRRKR